LDTVLYKNLPVFCHMVYIQTVSILFCWIEWLEHITCQ